jgi:hypothetical protein
MNMILKSKIRLVNLVRSPPYSVPGYGFIPETLALDWRSSRCFGFQCVRNLLSTGCIL